MTRWVLIAMATACTSGTPDAVSDDTDPADTDPADTEPVDTDVEDTDLPLDTDTPVDTDTDTDTDTDAALPDLRLAGPYTVDATSGALPTTSGCDLHWQRFTARGAGPAPLVVLTHGLQRSEDQMVVWARHLATWGLDVATPSSCAIDAWNLDQERNGRDLVELTTSFGATEVVYAGHSAGGLASWVAASIDARTVGLLGLDPVEWLGIGDAALPAIAAPTFGLVGDDSVCNAWGSAPGLIDGVPGSRRLRVVDADHCDFEVPTGPVCTLACGRSPNDRFTEAEIRATIRGLLTAALLDLTGRAAVADAWWAPGGPWHDLLAAEGRVD